MALILRILSKSFSLTILGISLHFSSFTQEIQPPETFTSPKIKSKYTRDAQILARALTEGLTSEKDKFDALFSWVVTNIRYDHRTFNSGKGIPDLKLKKVLMSRKGVCSHYASLMDSLCFYAGLTGVRIDGYTKGITFDVNDSLFFEDHSWNAVKLNNYWYLYDATWSSGGYEYEMKRFGQWRKKQLEKLLNHSEERIRTLSIKKKKNALCGIEGGKILAQTKEWVLPTPYRQLYRLVDLFPYRYRVKYRYVSSSNYYLTHPDVFALNHFPNDPMWSFSSVIRTLDDFRTDSTYYYGIKDHFRNQVREGRFCMECDDFLTLDELERSKETAIRAKRNLPHNPFIAAQAEMKTSSIYLSEFLNEKDSLTKMKLFDSIVIYIKKSRSDFSASRKPLTREFLFQKKKNKAKQNVLFRENREKQRKYNAHFKAVQNRQHKMRSIQTKLSNFDRRIKASRYRLIRSFSQSGSPITKEEKLNKLKQDLDITLFKVDSLSELTRLFQVQVLNETTDLWRGLLEQNKILFPIERLYSLDSYLRSTTHMDSYDREIRLIRNRIDTLELQFQGKIQLEILNRADSVFRHLKQLHQLSYKRIDLSLRAAKMMTKLNRSGTYPKEQMIAFKEAALENMKQDICWKEDHAGLFAACTGEFKKFYSKSRFFKIMISRNTKAEMERYLFIEKQNETTKRRISDVIRSNSSALQKMRHVADMERKRFLKSERK